MSGSAEGAGARPANEEAALSMDIEAPAVEAAAASEPAGNGGAAEDWRKALGEAVRSVVVLRATSTRAFDTESAGSMSATGFVVDRRRGILLTNRHVVGPGPIVAEAMFLNREEIPVFPLYRDPVHDFGFFRYDPGAVQFMEYEEIPLAPEATAVGLDIRVVGNDSGEKVSILAGTLARLDRDAPKYRKDGYNDFNIFYIQAASGTKSGSSGSPVIDCRGRAVALNAGSKSGSSSAYFLPLERVVRALHFLQRAHDEAPGGGGGGGGGGWTASPSIPRGTLQMTFLHKGFEETRRLGLRRETEQLVRDIAPPSETGMLVVDSVVPGGPAQKQLEPGDVLVRMNGEVMTQFLALETLLDDSVGKSVSVEVERGGEPVTVALEVQDLHVITPSLFLEVSGGVLHSLSYQQARNFRFECGRVYVAEPGYMLSQALVPTNAIITKIAGKDISRLEDFISVLVPLPRGERVPLEFLTYADRHRSKSVLVTVDRHQWYSPPLVYSRDDTTGFWQSRPALDAVARHESPAAGPCEEKKGSSEAIGAVEGQFSLLDGTAARDSGQEEHRGQNGEAAGCNAADPAGTNDGDLETHELNRCEEQDVMEVDGVLTVDDDPLAEKGKPAGVRPVEDAVNDDARAAGASSSVAEHAIEPALVMMEVHVPSSAKVDGLYCRHFVGTGVIVHHSKDLGLVVVDKNTVVIAISDVMLAFAAYPMEIPAEVVFLHPVHNFALVAYDPSALGAAGSTAIKAAVLHPDPPLRRGDAVQLVVLNRSLQTLSRKSIVTNPAVALNLVAADCPRYRAMNMDVIEIDTDFGNLLSGVLTDELGRVQALWGSFSTEVKYGDSTPEQRQFIRGIPVRTVCDVVKSIVDGCPGGLPLLINGVTRSMPSIRILEAELYPTVLTKARSFGLSDKWVQCLVKKDPVRRQVLRVNSCSAGSKAHEILEQGDMLLTIGGKPVTCFEDVEHACQGAGEDVRDLGGALRVTVFRHGKEMERLVGTDVRDGFGTTRMVCWAGCNVQDPHPAVRALGFLPEEGHGVYVAKWCSGSPSHRYGLYALQWIVEVNGKPTPDLQAFVDVTQALEDSEFVRVKTVDLNGKPRVLTLKQDLHYWPTWELLFDPATSAWCRRTIKSNTPVP